MCAFGQCLGGARKERQRERSQDSRFVLSVVCGAKVSHSRHRSSGEVYLGLKSREEKVSNKCIEAAAAATATAWNRSQP